MKILVGCEESQAVTIAFRKLGFEAYSCDLLPCSGGHPEWHLQQDILEVLEWHKWDAIIAFPPCTYMSNAGACRLYPKAGELNIERYNLGMQGKEFFMKFYNANCDFISVENPIPSSIFGLPKYTQIVQPYEFGHPYSKKTCLWLKGLPKLIPTNNIKGKEEIISYVSGGSKDNKGNPRINKGTKYRDSVTRSKTFPGIAEAMAKQWGEYLLTQNQ